MEVKELRHRGRLWRLADFVGGAGGSAKPSTEECCGEKGTQGGQQSLRSETFTQTTWTPNPKLLCVLDSEQSLPPATMQQSAAAEICLFARAKIFAGQTQMKPLTLS